MLTSYFIMSPKYSSQTEKTGRSTAQTKTSLKHTLVYQLKMSIPLKSLSIPYQAKMLLAKKLPKSLRPHVWGEDRLAAGVSAINITRLSWSSRYAIWGYATASIKSRTWLCSIMTYFHCDILNFIAPSEFNLSKATYITTDTSVSYILWV